MRIEMKHDQEEFGIEKQKHGPHRQAIANVETEAMVVKREQPKEIQPLTQSVHIAGSGLLGGTSGQLRLERVQLLHAHITPFTNLHVLVHARPTGTAAQHGIEARKNVLGQIDTLGCLGHTTPRHEEQLVKHIRMAIMKAQIQWFGQNALPQCDETPFLQRHKICDGRQPSGENVFPEPDDRLLPFTVKLLQQLPAFQRLLQVGLLVHVDGLQKLAASENDGMVLVFGLALSHDGIARQLDTVHLTNRRIGTWGSYEGRVEACMR